MKQQQRKRVLVDGQTGEVFSEDYELTVAIERTLYYSPIHERWVAPPRPGVTIVLKKEL